jgi:hypothetical protein
MNVSLMRTYRSKKGNVTFVYGVSGSAEDIAKFKEIQGEYYREDDNGKTLWFTTRCIGQSGSLIITTNNKIVPDMSKFDQAASLAKQFGGDLGQSLANAAAAQLLGHSAPEAAPAPAAIPVAQAEEVADEDEVE